MATKHQGPARRRTVHPLVQRFLAPPSAPQSVIAAPKRTLLKSIAWRGVTIYRFADGYEAVLVGGKRVSASSALNLLIQLLRNA